MTVESDTNHEADGDRGHEEGRRHGSQPSRRLAHALVAGGMGFFVVAVIAAFALREPSRPSPQVANRTALATPPSTRTSAAAPDPESDPLLRAGKEIFLARCVSCHGLSGKGDGPLARALPAPAPRDLTATNWRHGDDPEAALAVVSQGVKDTSMAGWSSMLGPEGTRSVTAYCLFLGKRAVPDAWRAR